MLIITIYLIGFILTLIAISLDMLYRDDFEGTVAWILSLIWPAVILSVIFLCLFNFMAALNVHEKIQNWYDVRIKLKKNLKRRKEDKQI